jgi:hypothetical protein
MCYCLRDHEKIHNGPQCCRFHDLLAYHWEYDFKNHSFGLKCNAMTSLRRFTEPILYCCLCSVKENKDACIFRFQGIPERTDIYVQLDREALNYKFVNEMVIFITMSNQFSSLCPTNFHHYVPPVFITMSHQFSSLFPTNLHHYVPPMHSICKMQSV